MLDCGFPKLKTDLQTIRGVRIVPYHDRYKVEIIYTYEEQDLHLNKGNVLGIDLGLINIITTSNNLGEHPIIIKGGILKSINQFYNKQLAKFKSLSTRCNEIYSTSRIKRLHRKRNNKIKDFFHKTSHFLISYCIFHDIGRIIIGYNEGWKQKINLSKKTNQSFVSIPFLTLIRQIEYKAQMIGINVERISEEYTSQTCSKCGIIRKSNRKHRGLYVCRSCGMVLNADVNASNNIIKKGIPNSFSVIGDRGCMDHPLVLKVCN